MTGSPKATVATVAAAVVLGAFAAIVGAVGPAWAQAPALTGEAYGHYTSVSLFGGPASPVGPDPKVALPAGGSAQPVAATDADGATAQYGPARIFAGIWPPNVQQAPPSGPISVSTKGTPGPTGSVTSTADIGLYPTPIAVACDNDAPGKTSCTAPGGFGPMPVTQGEQLHSTCTATPGGVTGSATFVKAQVAKSTDANGEPTDVENIPDRPPANYTKTGTITNVGDNWRIVYNEQTVDPDGTLTVNAIHMFLLGPIAIGEQILGHVRCGLAAASSPTTTTPATTAPASTTVSTTTPSTTTAPVTTAPATTEPVASTAAPASVPIRTDQGSSVLPYVVVAAAVLVALVLLAVRRARKSATGGPGPP